MNTHTFRVVVTAPIDDEGANRLFETGVDDGYPETGPAGHSIGFDRQASDFPTAVLSAVEQIEEAGFEVFRVEPDELVSAADVAERTGRTRQSISSLINGSRGPGGWPRPVAGNVRSPLWRWTDVAGWFEAYDGSQSLDEERAKFLAAVNEVLAARRALRPVDENTRKLLANFVA